MRRRVLAALRCAALCGGLLACVPLALAQHAPPRTVVLIGGPHTEGAGKHEYGQGVAALARLLEATPGPAAFDVRAFPDGWPEDPRAFEGADTIVWYFEGEDRHPLRDAARRRQFARLMERGVGLVALHQASTVPADDDFGLRAWLGGVRRGLFDRSTEFARLQPASAPHPVGVGLEAFSYRDEFYPTLAFEAGAVPLLRADLHPQFRAGEAVLAAEPETRTVAWAFERPGGGRSVGFTGAHFLASFDEPGLRTLLGNAIQWTAGLAVDAVPIATFHQDRARSGWFDREKTLTPALLASGGFGLAWESPPLDAVDGQAPRLYASPLYVDNVTLRAGPHRGQTHALVIAASNNGVVYAVNARKQGDVAAGRILWRTPLAAPCRLQPAPLDGVPTGILATPVIDLARQRLYVTHCDPEQRWQAYALDLRSGAVLPGWPVRLDEETLNQHNANAGPERVPPRRRFDFRVQRGALNLSPDGSLLYVVFGESETGWLAAVDTRSPAVVGAFAAAAMPHRGSGGIWGAGGPAVDADGSVFVVTGSGFDGYKDQAHDWTQSVLKLRPPVAGRGFELTGTYSPFNHCQTAKMDIDLGSGGALLLPDRAGAALLAVGGKQGNLTLLDRNRMPGRLDRRPECSLDPSTDGSLLSPKPQPAFGKRGPLNLFGPYSEQDAALDLARGRSVPAVFRDADGGLFLFATGNTKQAEGSATSVPPSLARVAVAGASARKSYLELDRIHPDLVLGNPGSPVISSDGSRNAVLWVLDENAPRSASLAGDDGPRPVLYAFDAQTLAELWRSGPGQLHTSGKYNEPAFGGGQVYVGTDRIQAFGAVAAGSRAAASGTATRAEVTSPPSTGSTTAATGRTAAVAANNLAQAASNPAAPAAGADSAAIYAQRCAACHDDPQGNIPPRRVLASRSHERIVRALSSGVMRAQAAGLSAEQIEAMARYLK